MANFSSRSPSKGLVTLFILFLVLASFNLHVIFKPQFSGIKNTIEKELSVALDKRVSIKNIVLLPYGDVIFKDISIRDIKTGLSCVEIDKFNIRFSILEILRSRNIVLNKHKKSKEFNLKGTIIFKKPEVIGPVKYKLNTIITPDVISIGDLFLDSDKFKMDIKGNINNYAYSPIVDLNITADQINLYNRAAISNLYSEIFFSKDKLFIKKLNFFINNFPLGMRCRISDFKSPVIELDIVSYPGQIKSLRPFNPFNFEMHYSGKGFGNSAYGNLTFTTEKLISINPRRIYHAMLKLNNLSCGLLNKAVSIGAEEVILETDTLEKTLDINASDFRTHVYLGKNKAYFTGLSISVYKGIVKGSGFMNFEKWPVKSVLDFKAYGLDAAELAAAFGLNYEINGRMDFRGVFNSAKDPVLSGRIDIKDGYLKNSQVLGMVSEFLNVPSLKDIYFSRISSQAYFSKTNKEAIFDNISVSGKDINLSGDIKLKSMKKINGAISIKLPTALLKESFKLRLLFFIVGEKLPYQDFEFEIGGFLNSPQIRWLSTRFRENVLKHLTGGGKKAIEKSLEKAMQQLL